MKRSILITVLALIVNVGYAQKNQDSIKTEEVLETIIHGLKDQAFERARQEAHSKKDNVIFNEAYLYSELCYRQLLSKTTGDKVYIQVECGSIHSNTGFHFKELKAIEIAEHYRKNRRKIERLNNKIDKMHN
jgi:hypothetical protein